MRFFASTLPFVACALAVAVAEPAHVAGRSNAQVSARDSGYKINYYTDGGCTDYLVSIFPSTDGSCYDYSYTGDNSANIANCDGSNCQCTFYNQAGLEAIGDNLFLQSGSSGQPVTGTPNSTGFGYIQQGYTESSNVDPVSEISALIVAQRAYEMNSKVVTSADQMLQTTSQMKS